MSKICSIEECSAVPFGHGWCRKHYSRWYRHGDPLTLLKTGITHHKLYSVWAGIIARCSDVKFKNYAGRGITVCDRWRLGENGVHGFECFVADMGDRPTKAHTVERKDNNLGYSPTNCKWGTRQEQSDNRRSNIMIEFEGITLNLAQWCKMLGVPRRIVSQRIRREGWTFVKAVTTSRAEAKREASHKTWTIRRSRAI